LTCCWPEVRVPDPSTVVRLPTASFCKSQNSSKRGPNGARTPRRQGGHITAHGHAEISPRPRPSDSSGAWNPSFHAICPRLSAACRRSQGTAARRLTRPTTCAVPVVQPPVILPPGHSRHCQDGGLACVWILPSIAASMATAALSKSSRTWSGESGFGPRWSQRIDSARRQTLWIFTLTWCGGFAANQRRVLCHDPLAAHLLLACRATINHITYSSSRLVRRVSLP
jgi:hypothetical protein